MNTIRFSHKNRILTFVEGNKLYLSIDPSYTGNKTIYHFKNMDVIMPNLFDFDIHNYSDEIIRYDRRRKGRFIISGKLINIRTDIEEYHHYDAEYHTDKSIGYPILDNTIQIMDDKIIFYYLNKYDQYKIYSIIFPKELLHNVSCLTINCILSVDEIMFMIYYYHQYEPLVISVTKSKVARELKIDDEEIIHILKDDGSKDSYTKFLLSNI